MAVEASSTSYLVLPPPIQQLGQATNIPLCMCFIDLKKAYDSVDRQALWAVLARFGVPDKMLIGFRQLQECMRARVRTDNGDHSKWSYFTQGLRLGCVLSRLCFNIFFAAVTHAMLVPVGEDP